MPKFRKKPVEIEARQFTGDNADELVAWLADHGVTATGGTHPPAVNVPTLEGPLAAGVGHWIVKGGVNEFWPVRDDVFRNSYDPM